VEHLAGTLAAKEAVIKSLRLGPLVAWSRRIEIHREQGVPYAVVDGQTVPISISHDGGVAAAIAVVA
jgi:phosphopantetheinyl transferase (holo-ACP synthase)